jgi:hypothetical protein
MKLPKNEQELEEFVRTKGLYPAGYYDYKGQTIYLAETLLETNKKHEYPWGYYQVAWFVRPAVNGARFDGGSWVEFDAMHDMDQTTEARAKGRINAAKQNAQEWIDNNLSSKRYETH